MSKKILAGALCKYGHPSGRYNDTGACKECARLRTATYRLRHPDRVKKLDSDKARRYRMKVQGIVGIIPPKPELCPLCIRPPTKRGFFLDHCHDTGKIRGWLCMPCNSALGTLGDTVESIERVLRYLRQSQEQP